MSNSKKILYQLIRIADSLDRISPIPNSNQLVKNADTYEWIGKKHSLNVITNVNRINIDLLLGIHNIKNTLIQNTMRFANNFPANNVLLWGARGMGKSSLIKSCHFYVRKNSKKDLVLVEIYKNEISTLPDLLRILGKNNKRFIIFCDDLSFEQGEYSYKALKSLLEGGIEKKPDNVIFYATSNRRHLIARDIIENEQNKAIHEKEVVEEKISLSDRFGLSLGFYNCSQKEYFNIVKGYSMQFKFKISDKELEDLALKWSISRGSRSGRVAWQFIQDLAGKLEKKL